MAIENHDGAPVLGTDTVYGGVRGHTYRFTMQAGDTLEVHPELAERVSAGRVSFGWAIHVDASAPSIQRAIKMTPDAEWVIPLKGDLTPEDAITEDWSDYESAPFAAMRWVQTGGGDSEISFNSRWALAFKVD